jgi:broad specificity phosphatase PhoE
MLVLLVRHGHAGAKRDWHGDDGFRPLDTTGLDQASALVPLLTRILSSPLVRCVQTVTPLGDTLGIPIERSPSLVPEAGAAATLLARQVSIGEGGGESERELGSQLGAVVLCTHGEVIHQMQALLAHEALTGFSPASPREKGSVWVLDRTDGRFTGACYLAPEDRLKPAG